MVQLIIFGIQEAITLAPPLYADLQQLFASPTPPTPEQFQALITKISSGSYQQFVPASAIPAGQ